VEAEGRGGAEIDVRRIGIVEGDAEDLADFGRRHRQALLLVQPVMTLRRLAGPPHVDDRSNDPGRIDDLGLAFGLGPGEAGHVSLAGLISLAGLLGRRRRQAIGGELEKERATDGLA
jgi:hypothetical protein